MQVQLQQPTFKSQHLNLVEGGSQNKNVRNVPLKAENVLTASIHFPYELRNTSLSSLVYLLEQKVET